jgi:hypothetical protein
MSDGSKHQPRVTAGLDLGDKYSYTPTSASSTNTVVRWSRRGGCAPPPRPSGDASPHSGLLCA